MALIICSECGKQVSNMAVSCPNCGAIINTSIYTQSNLGEIFSLETCDKISSMLNKFLFIGFLLLLPLVFIDTQEIFGAIVALILTTFIFLYTKATKSRIASAINFGFWFFTLLVYLIKHGSLRSSFADINMLLYIVILAFILYLTILFHQKNKK